MVHAFVAEGSRLIRSQKNQGRWFLVNHAPAALDHLALLQVQQLDFPARKDVAQINVVAHCRDERAKLRDAGMRVLHEDRNPAAVFGHAKPLAVQRRGRAVSAAVVIEVTAVLAAEQVDPGISTVADRLDQAVPQPIDGLLQPPPEIAPPGTLAPRQRTVGPAIGQDGGEALEGHPLCLVGQNEQRERPMPLVCDPDAPRRMTASLLDACIAFVAVGNQFYEGLFHGGKTP